MLQAFLWAGLVVGAVAASSLGYTLPGLALLLAALLLPRTKKSVGDVKATAPDNGKKEGLASGC
jgi:hypothetical protein